MPHPDPIAKPFPGGVISLDLKVQSNGGGVMSDRRISARCPVCQGPTLADEQAPMGCRCRRSICPHNHQNISCSRCGGGEIDSITREAEGFRYHCHDCGHSFARTSSAVAPE